MYEVDRVLKIAEEDDFYDGCLPETTQMTDLDISFSGETQEELIEEIKRFFNVDDDCVLLNECDEDGRIDVAMIEDINGDSVSTEELCYLTEDWKKRKIKLFYVVYTMNAFKVTRESVKLI